MFLTNNDLFVIYIQFPSCYQIAWSRSNTLPFCKLTVKDKVVISQHEITKELYEYYSNLFTSPTLNQSDPFAAQVEKDYNCILDKLKLCNKTVELAHVPTNSKRMIDTLITEKISRL